MKEHDGDNPLEMPRGQSEHEAPQAPTAATATVDTSCGVAPAPRAQRGQRVAIWVDVIKADKREVWERFIHEVIAPAAHEVDPEVLARTRFLEPVEANEDGTWTFVIMPDPLDQRFDYDSTRYVRETLGQEKADEADRIWDECHAKDQYEFSLLESAW